MSIDGEKHKMSKYDPVYTTPGFGSESQLAKLIQPDETVLWSGKPFLKAFVVNSVVPFMPFAILWLCFDIFFLCMVCGDDNIGGFIVFFIVFLLLHMFPFWLWIVNAASAKKRWSNTEYAITDKRILIRTGFIGYECMNIYYKDITDIHLSVGIFDKMLGVGDIQICLAGCESHKDSNSDILDIVDYEEVFNKLQATIRDIQSDIEYPNAYRPAENPGYHTSYKGQ